MRRPSVLATLVLVCCASPAAAAQQRFASPGGTGDCSQPSPCDIATAINNATSGDEVILAPGDYGSPGSELSTQLQSSQTNLDVHGVDGQPRPRIYTNTLFGLDLAGSGSKARHFEIHQSANGSYQSALVLDSGQASDMVLSNLGGSSAAACTLLGSSTLTNSVCEATGSNAYGIFPYRRTVGPLANSSIIRNATVVAPGTGATGIYAVGGDTADKAENLTVTNTIVSPQTNTSLFAYPQTGDATITIDHSNFGYQNDLAHIHKGEGNQQLTKPPTFVASGNYHEAPGSITIDAGATNALNGLTDFDGDARSLGLGGTDIGADEFVPPPTAVTGDAGFLTTTAATVNGTVNPNTIATTFHFDLGTSPAYGAATPERSAGSGTTLDPVSEALSGLTPGTTYHYRLVATSAGGTTAGEDRTFTTTGTSPGQGGGGGDVVAPRITGLTLKPGAFAAGRRARITVTVSEAATLRFTVQRRRGGRKARYVTRGRFAKKGKAGRNRIAFRGRLKGRKLPAGRYRLRVVATDAAGNRSKARSVTFRILRR